MTTDVDEPIRRVRLTTCSVPTTTDGRRMPETDGTARWDATMILLVEITAGTHTGIGYAYTTAGALQVSRDVLTQIVIGSDPFAATSTWYRMAAAVRNAGWSGIAAGAVSAVDIALYDLAARIANLPLVRFLGAASDRVEAYGSGGFTNLDDAQLERQLGRWAAEGYRAVKMKVGTDPSDDPRRVEVARRTIGSELALYVDANGAYDARQALMLADRFADQDVTWFEEPVSSDDLDGMRFVRARNPTGMRVAAGEYSYRPADHRRLIDSGAVDVLQADATRCGGITGFRNAAEQAVAAGIPLSAHTAPALHAVLGSALHGVMNVEAFHDHLLIETALFDGVAPLIDGAFVPDADAPGLGLALRGRDVERYRTASWQSEADDD